MHVSVEGSDYDSYDESQLQRYLRNDRIDNRNCNHSQDEAVLASDDALFDTDDGDDGDAAQTHLGVRHNMAKYGIYFSEDDEQYDYMQHLRPMGLHADAVYVASKNVPISSTLIDTDRPPSGINQGHGCITSGSLESAISQPLEDPSMSEGEFSEDDANVAFLDDLLAAGRVSSSIEDELTSDASNLHDFHDSDCNGDELDSQAIYHGHVDNDFDENVDGDDVVMQTLDADALEEIMDDFLENSSTRLAPLSKHGDKLERAVQELEAIKRALKIEGVTSVPSAISDAYRFQLNSGEEEEPYDEKVLYADVDEEWDAYYKEKAQQAFIPLEDAMARLAAVDASPVKLNQPKLIRETIYRPVKEKQRSTDENDILVANAFSKTKFNYGSARPKNESSEEKRVRKQVAKSLKKEQKDRKGRTPGER